MRRHWIGFIVLKRIARQVNTQGHRRFLAVDQPQAARVSLHQVRDQGNCEHDV